MASSSARHIELTLAVGGRHLLPLTSAGSVGYEWHVAVDGTAATAKVCSRPAADPQLRGSADLFLEIDGLQPGHSDIALTLMRVPGSPPRETIAITVTVTP